MAGAAVFAAVTVIEEDGLVENSASLGEWMLGRLRDMQEKYEFIGDVRGKGLLIGVELVKDRRTREPLDKAVCARLFKDGLDHGLISMVYNPHFRVNPPLSMDRSTAETALEILEGTFARLSRAGGWR